MDMKKITPVTEKVREVRTQMKESLVERGTEIDLTVLCTIARVHAVFLGDPGVGKSMLIRELLGHIDDSTMFELLLNKNTPPEALVGPISLKGLENDEFRRVTTNKMPEAHVAFLDEIFKSNATNLNLLLAMVNERLFHNGGVPVQIPLWSVFGASNETPTHDKQELMAFFDRLAVRRVVAPVRTSDGLQSVFAGQIERDLGNAVSDNHTMLARTEIEMLQSAAREITVPNRVLAKMAELQLKASDEGLNLSSRRMGDGRRLAQANALLNDRGEVVTEDLRIFEHIIWDDIDDIATASELTLDFAGEVGKVVANLRSEYEEAAAKLTTAQGMWPADSTEPVSEEATSKMVQVSSSLQTLDNRIERAIDEAEADGYDPSELDSIKQDVKRARATVREALGMGI